MSDKNPNDDWLYRNMIEKSPVAIIYADAAGIIHVWNRGAEEIFGWTAEEVLGQPMDLIIPEKYRTRHWEGYHRTMESGITKYGHTPLAVPAMTKSGNLISIEFNVHLLKGPSGKAIGIAAFLRDVTARRQEDIAMRRRLALLEAWQTTS
jgi:PAS domain S-box-containing protein